MANKEIKTEQAPAAIGPYSQGISAENIAFVSGQLPIDPCLLYTSIVVGIWAGRSVKDVNDYYVSGRNAPTILIAGTLFASMLSVNGFMGDQGWCYSGNITTLVLLNSMCAMGYIAGPLMFGRCLLYTSELRFSRDVSEERTLKVEMSAR